MGSWLAYLVLLSLLLVALARGAAFLSVAPPAFADRDDAARSRACFGAEAPQPAAARGVRPACDPTSGALLALAAGPALRTTGSGASADVPPARKTGVATFVLLMIIAGWGTWVLSRRAGTFAAVVLATLTALVLADPAVLAHAYTLAGFAPCLFLVATLVSLAAVGVEHQAAGVLRWIAALALLGFATSVVPHLALGFIVLALFAAACIASGRRDWPTLLALFAAASIGFAVVVVFARPEVEAMARRIAAAQVEGFADLRPLLPPGFGLAESASFGFLHLNALSWSRVVDGLPLREYLVFLLGPPVLLALCAVFGAFRRREAGATFTFAALALLPFPMLAGVAFGGEALRPGDAYLAFACLVAFWVVAAIAVVAGLARFISDTLRGFAFRALDAARARGRTGTISAKAANPAPPDPASPDRIRNAEGASDSSPA